LFTEGGVFIPTSREYKLGDDVYVLMTLPDDSQRYGGRQGRLDHTGAAGSRTQRRGIRFPADDKSRLLKIKIEEFWAPIWRQTADSDDLIRTLRAIGTRSATVFVAAGAVIDWAGGNSSKSTVFMFTDSIATSVRRLMAELPPFAVQCKPPLTGAVHLHRWRSSSPFICLLPRTTTFGRP
jgi:type IV pilus assembly protein PilZ